MEEYLNVINSVGTGFGLGKDISYALSTSENSVYRVTGMDQIEDIVNCGYVRPKGYGKRRERVGDKIYWSTGGKNLYFYDKRPVLEAPGDRVIDGQIGAIPLEDLEGIWIFDEENNKYINNIEYYISLYDAKKGRRKE